MSGMSKNLGHWQWEEAASGAVAGFTTVASLHPLDVVRTRFQVNDGRVTHIPLYKNTVNALLTIGRTEGLKGLYAGFHPAVLGSTVSWGLYFFFYNRAKQRYSKGGSEKLSAGYHLVSAAEAGGLVCLCTNPIWLVKTRLQLQTPLHQTRPYSGFYDALRTILREEGVSALYKGMGPGLLLVSYYYYVSHGAIQFTVYEELRKLLLGFKGKEGKTNIPDDKLLQRPGNDGTPKYMSSWHVVKDTVRFEGFPGYYKGITSNLLKNVPAASITFVVYENVLNIFKRARRKD
ncbi:folate transporter 1, chloroplastic-like isoform X4 [Papaver somniferum]|uniref:folate transporter 1, chloroplastic-like isoform X4 n=1 Tax=Papaver somniferum TaxID=3469 RepID=UPI000E701D33|nr:folate transporter 1, chloroplastic-like isoform X4 [Papaver somniferum]